MKDPKDPRNTILTVPNLLSAFRIVISFLIILGIIENWYDIFMWGSIVAIFDFFDGSYARKYKAESYLGAILDPAGDKLLVVAVLYRINPEFGIIVACLESLSSLFGYSFRKKDDHIIAHGSKGVTAFQMLFLLILVLSKLELVTFFDFLQREMFGLMLGLSLSRACMYGSLYWQKRKEKKVLTIDKASETSQAA